MLLGEAAALLNAVVWAATGVTAKTLSPAVRPIHVITAHTLLASVAFIVIAAVSDGLDGLVHAPAAALSLFAAAALLNTAGSLLFFTAITTGSVGGTYTTTTGLYILLSLVAGALVFDETVGPLAALGAAGIAVGVFVLNGPGRASQPRSIPNHQVRSLRMEGGAGAAPAVRAKTGAPPLRASITAGAGRMMALGVPYLLTGLGLGAATAVLWTMGLLVMKWGLERSDVITGSFMRNAVAAMVYLGYAAISRRVRVPRTDRGDWSRLLLSAGFFAVSVYSWNYALSHSRAGVTAVLASTSPVFALLMAAGFLGERLGRTAVAGAGVAIIGTLLVVTGR
jgi:drug/metabolite transporter (DMT)-like permease